MPVDGTGTDEPLSGPAQRKKDFEAQLMAGCMTIGVVSMLTYFLTVWPFVVFPEYSMSGLVKILLAGALPATILGVVAARRFALAGSAGFFGGAMAGAVFMQLRLQQTLLGKIARDMPKPDYPDIVAWGLPFLWFAWAGLVAWIFCRRERTEG